MTIAVLGLTLARPAAGQVTSSRFNQQTFGAWKATEWNAIRWRTRCEGGPLGMDTGPIKWMVEFRNAGKVPVSFDYVVLPPRGIKPPPDPTRATLKPGKTLQRLVVVATNHCEEGVGSVVNSVRFGEDSDSLPYAPMDNLPSRVRN
jgi:hypothetical protein